MGVSLKALWRMLGSASDPVHVEEIQKEINRIEEWRIEQGHDIKVTDWTKDLHRNLDFSKRHVPGYPDRHGAVYIEDLNTI